MNCIRDSSRSWDCADLVVARVVTPGRHGKNRFRAFRHVKINHICMLKKVFNARYVFFLLFVSQHQPAIDSAYLSLSSRSSGLSSSSFCPSREEYGCCQDPESYLSASCDRTRRNGTQRCHCVPESLDSRWYILYGRLLYLAPS